VKAREVEAAQLARVPLRKPRKSLRHRERAGYYYRWKLVRPKPLDYWRKPERIGWWCLLYVAHDFAPALRVAQGYVETPSRDACLRAVSLAQRMHRQMIQRGATGGTRGGSGTHQAVREV
jgi:hypothetical protein